MKMEIHVVNRGGEKCFRSSDGQNPIFFNALSAEDFFYYTPGSLSLFRKGSTESVGTASIRTIGTHGPVTEFDVKSLASAFRRALSDDDDPERITALYPDDFEEGDRLVLDFPYSDDCAQSVLDDFRRYDAFHRALYRRLDVERHYPETEGAEEFLDMKSPWYENDDQRESTPQPGL